jgi:transposase
MVVLDRHDMTDAQWALLEPLLPDRAPQRGPRPIVPHCRHSRDQ